MSDALPLDSRIRFGVMAPALDGEQARHAAASIASLGFDGLWTGDHVAFTTPISEPLTQLAFCGALAPRLTIGTGVYLLPLRNPVTVAKSVATLDRMLGRGRFIFGIGVGGEFPREYEACGVPLNERGGRTNEAIPLMKRLWSEPAVEHRGKYFSFAEIKMEPKPATPGGPPIWVGGRADAALKRAARLADGWMPYVVTPKRYADGLDFIGAEAARAGRRFASFGTAVFLFCTMGATYEKALDVATGYLSKRYAMDFREPARRYGAVGRPADAAAKIGEYIKVGVRDVLIDLVCSNAERDAQLEQIAREVVPLLRPTL